MDFVTGLMVIFGCGFAAQLIGVYIDHRRTTRVRKGELPPTTPRLMIPLIWIVDPIRPFSPGFSRLQDRTTRWLVLPLRLCLAAAWGLLFGGLAWIALFPAA